MSWEVVGSRQKGLQYANKHDRGRTFEKKQKNIVKTEGVKEIKSDVNDRMVDLAFRLVVLSQLQNYN